MNWDKIAYIAVGWVVIYGFGKQLEAIHKVLIEIRQALWDLRQQR